MYSFGLLAWQLLSYGDDFFMVDMLLLFRRIVDCDARPDFPRETHHDLKNLIEACWHQTASLRPSFAEIRAKLDCMLAEDMKASFHPERLHSGIH